MKPLACFAIIIGLCSSCSSPNQQQMNPEKTVAEKTMAEKPFGAGGKIDMRLDSGNYDIRAAAEDQIRIVFSGNTGDASAEVTANGSQANLEVKGTPQNNFHASIEVPRASNLVIHLKAGNLAMAGITGNKDINSGAGNVEVAVGDPNDYSNVDASVKAGDIDAGVFGKSGSGLLPHITWEGHGKYTLHASLGAGNLVLKSK